MPHVELECFVQWNRHRVLNIRIDYRRLIAVESNRVNFRHRTFDENQVGGMDGRRMSVWICGVRLFGRLTRHISHLTVQLSEKGGRVA